MKKRRPNEDDAINMVPAWDVLTSVGVTGMQMVEAIEYGDYEVGFGNLLDLARQMDAALQVLASFSIDNEKLLRLVLVEVPPNIVSIRAKNPLYQKDMGVPPSDEGDTSHGD